MLQFNITSVRERRGGLEYRSKRLRDIKRALKRAVFWTLVECLHPILYFVVVTRIQQLITNSRTNTSHTTRRNNIAAAANDSMAWSPNGVETITVLGCGEAERPARV
jgi:hypothetical protein